LLLLDHNIPAQIFRELKSRSIACDTAKQRGWDQIKNGALVELASKNGFTCVVTRDRLLHQEASAALKKFPNMCIVIITLPQSGGKKFSEAFRKEWEKAPFIARPGQLINWPA